MNCIKTNRDLFLILKDTDISFKNGIMAINKVKELANTDYLHFGVQKRIRNFCAKLNLKWTKACRAESRLIGQNKLWLDLPFEFPVDHVKGDDPVTSRKIFYFLSDRQKWRYTKYMRKFPKEHISFVAKKQHKSKNAQFVIEFMRKHPEHARIKN